MEQKNVLILKNVSKTFYSGTPNQNNVLNKLNLIVEKGEFITIIGGNGSGKSTMLNSIAGTFLIEKGSIKINEKEIKKLKEEQRAKLIGRVFQDPLMGTAPRMTVSENLSIAYRRGQKRTLRKGSTVNERHYFEALLTKLDLGLEKRLDSEMGLLSGGQRQAIALLMATMKKPELLLLDEHTAALDPKTATVVLELTRKRIEEEELTALMITHNMQDALNYGNRLIMLDKGRVVIDLSGDDKKDLTVSQILDLFQKKTKNQLLEDEILLG